MVHEAAKSVGRSTTGLQLKATVELTMNVHALPRAFAAFQRAGPLVFPENAAARSRPEPLRFASWRLTKDFVAQLPV
jgi:hypothetical protein